jgi:hypoxanthine phosphoribosyltransferase
MRLTPLNKSDFKKRHKIDYRHEVMIVIENGGISCADLFDEFWGDRLFSALIH